MQSLINSLQENKKISTNRIMALRKDKERQNAQISTQFGDQAQDIENDEVIDELEKLELAKLEDLNHALKRIENGSYGVCSNCSEKIEYKRLVAVPTAKLCRNCA